MPASPIPPTYTDGRRRLYLSLRATPSSFSLLLGVDRPWQISRQSQPANIWQNAIDFSTLDLLQSWKKWPLLPVHYMERGQRAAHASEILKIGIFSCCSSL